MTEFRIGDRVDCEDRGKGVVAYYGETQFRPGIWVGIILDEAKGKNNGTVEGVKYFECKENHGTFIKPDKVRLIRGTGLKPPSSSLRKPGSVRPSPASSVRPSPAQTPRMSPAVSVEQLAKATPHKPPPQSESRMPRVSEAEVPKEEPKTSIPKPAPTSDLPVPSVKEMAKKHDKDPAPVFTPQTSFSIGEPEPAAESANVQHYLDEIADLNKKLENLRKKRDEDLTKIKENERLKIQCQSLMEFKTSVLEELRIARQKHEDLQSKLDESEKRYEELKASTSKDFDEQLELVTLDKLVAEQRIEVLQAEVTEKSDRIMFLEGELALQKASRFPVDAENGVDQEDGHMTDTSEQSSDIREQLERYKDAIIQMRDFVTAANLERDEIEQKYQQCQEDRQRLEAEYERLLRISEDFSNQILGLNEQLDDALGSARMVEHLTEKNLDLEDRVRTLLDEKEQLEELVQLSEEISETARETQMELRRECDGYIVQYAEKCNEVQILENQIGEYNNIVQKFRQRIGELNNEIVDYNDKIRVLEHQLDEHNTSGSTNLTALFSSTRTFSDLIASELNALEMKSLEQYSNYLRIFLSDGFSKPGGDLDCVLLLVFFPRLTAKSNLLARLFAQKFPNLPDGMQREHVVKSNKAEQWANVRKFTYYLHVLGSVSGRFETMLSNCTLESLTRLALQRTEMTNQENTLKHYFELLKSNQFDENTSVDPLNRSTALFQKIFSVNVSATEYDTRKAFADYLQQFNLGLQWVRFNCDRLKLFLFEGESEGNDFVDFINELNSMAERIQSQTLHAQKWIPTDKLLDLSHDMLDVILNGVMLLEKIASILHETNSVAVSQLVANDIDGFSINELKEMLRSVVEKREGHKSVKEAIEEVRSSMDALSSCVEEIATKLEKRQFELPLPVERPNPLVERSQNLKQNEGDVENLRWEVNKKDDKLHQQTKALKALSDEISVLRVQVERERKKALKAAGQTDSLTTVTSSERLHELASDEREKYEQQVVELNEKVADLEKRLGDKENQIKRTNVAFMDPTARDLIGDSKILTQGPKITGFQQTPAELLQSLHLAQERIRRLQAELDERRLSVLKPLNLPVSNVCGVESMRLRSTAPQNTTEQIELKHKALLDESNLLLLEFKELSAIPMDKRNNDSYRRKLADYNRRVTDLRVRTRAFAAKHFPHVPPPSSCRIAQAS